MAAGKLIQFRLSDEELRLLDEYLGGNDSKSESLKAKKALLSLITSSNQIESQSNQDYYEKLADIEATLYQRLSQQVESLVEKRLGELVA
jgi:ribosomal protein L30E